MENGRKRSFSPLNHFASPLVNSLSTELGSFPVLLGLKQAQGATLQNYNNELVKCIEDLREKREEVNRAILKEEEVGLPKGQGPPSTCPF